MTTKKHRTRDEKFARLIEQFQSVDAPYRADALYEMYDFYTLLGYGHRVHAMWLQGMSDPDGRVRRRAIKFLVWIDDASDIHHIENALHDSDDWVRFTAAQALLRKKYTEIVPLFGDLLLRSPDRILKREVMVLLYQLDTAEIIETFITSLNDTDWAVRGMAASHVGRLRLEHAIPFLRLCLEDKHDYVTSRVRYALREIDTPEALRVLEEHGK
jgi:HEAT repeat protein